MNTFDALHATAHDPKHGGTDVLAMRLGMRSGAMLRNKTNPNNPDHHMRLDETLRLMELTGDYRVLEAMAHEHGFVCIKLPDGFDVADVCMFEQSLQVGVSKGQLSADTMRSLSDGRICQGDVKRLTKSANKLVKDILTFLHLAKEVAK